VGAVQQDVLWLGWVDDDLTPADRAFCCGRCGLVRDRELNAAINLAKLAGSSLERVNACGEVGSGQRQMALVKPSPMKQEPNTA